MCDGDLEAQRLAGHVGNGMRVWGLYLLPGNETEQHRGKRLREEVPSGRVEACAGCMPGAPAGGSKS